MTTIRLLGADLLRDGIARFTAALHEQVDTVLRGEIAKIKRTPQMKKQNTKDVTRSKRPTASRSSVLETFRDGVAHDWGHSDSRVISRRRDVLQYELAATDEHVAGLRASLAEVTAKRARLVAAIEGLTAVLSKR